MKGLRLYKYEKLCSKKTIEDLFASKNNSVKSYPIRLIYTIEPFKGTPAQFYISVPKRKIRHAVDRVLMRRRIREAYRLNRHLVLPQIKEANKSVFIAFVFIGDTITDYNVIEERMKQALSKLAKAVSETNEAGIQQPPTPLPNA